MTTISDLKELLTHKPQSVCTYGQKANNTYRKSYREGKKSDQPRKKLKVSASTETFNTMAKQPSNYSKYDSFFKKNSDDDEEILSENENTDGLSM